MNLDPTGSNAELSWVALENDRLAVPVTPQSWKVQYLLRHSVGDFGYRASNTPANGRRVASHLGRAAFRKPSLCRDPRA